ncbi:MAG: response regulator [Pseudomonadota bacterium]
MDLGPLNVLVVDDNKHMVQLLKAILYSLGVKNVREAYDGADAFMELRNFPADIVFTDLAMSPLDGLEFTRLVRNAKDSPNPYVHIIMLTGHTEFVRLRASIDAGITDFLAKPVSAKSVYQRILGVIRNPPSFVREKNYFGPDRRRFREDRLKSNFLQRSRNKKTNPGSEQQLSAEGLSQDEVSRLLQG